MTKAGAQEKQQVVVLGSTGSVGTTALRVLGAHTQKFQVVALSAHKNVKLLVEQVRKFSPQLAVIGDVSLYGQLKDALANSSTKVLAGDEGLLEAACYPAQTVVAAMVGIAGLAPVLASVRKGRKVVLANKESVVCGGSFLLAEAKAHGATIIPVDSEHNALFQMLERKNKESIARLVLTASGGPFWQYDLADMKSITPAQACKHPTWAMGPKISVDSATLMNKALEVAEAHYLFGFDHEKLDVLIHPSSIVHALITYRDGCHQAYMGPADMALPLTHGLFWPHVAQMSLPSLDLSKVGALQFFKPDDERFTALKLVHHCLAQHEQMVNLLNAANEVAVAAFLDERLPFLSIMPVVEETVERGAQLLNKTGRSGSLQEIMETHGQGQKIAHDVIRNRWYG